MEEEMNTMCNPELKYFRRSLNRGLAQGRQEAA